MVVESTLQGATVVPQPHCYEEYETELRQSKYKKNIRKIVVGVYGRMRILRQLIPIR
jgi:hypothetical protein